VTKYAMLEALLTMSIQRLADYLTFDLASDRYRNSNLCIFDKIIATLYSTTKIIIEFCGCEQHC
jgi:hypothetical protein